MNAGDTITYQGMTLKVVQILEDGRVEALSEDGLLRIFVTTEVLLPPAASAEEIEEEEE